MRTIALLLVFVASIEASKLATETKQYDMYDTSDYMNSDYSS